MAEDKDRKTPDQKEPETTGHEWDGIKEYNNPLPRWWVYIFAVTVVWAIGYAVVYPAIPLIHGHTPGMKGWTEYKQLDAALAEAAKTQKPLNDKIAAMDVKDILADRELRDFAVAGGKSAFALNCAVCHGSGAQGGKGYPSLLDDEWLWGGRIEDILQTITHGIRAPGDPDTRMSAMTPFGRDGLLKKDQILDLVAHVRTISGNAQPSEASARGAALFAENCTACHGDKGQGLHEFGAPRLSNDIWLYGGSEDTIYETIWGGRGGVMPAWKGRLDDVTIKKLAVYVHSLSGGEKIEGEQ